MMATKDRVVKADDQIMRERRAEIGRSKVRTKGRKFVVTSGRLKPVVTVSFNQVV